MQIAYKVFVQSTSLKRLHCCNVCCSVSLQTAGVIIVAYACMDLRELALPGGFLMLLLSAAAQLPFFIFLCNYLDGDTTVGMKVRCCKTAWHTLERVMQGSGHPGSLPFGGNF